MATNQDWISWPILLQSDCGHPCTSLLSSSRKSSSCGSYASFGIQYGILLNACFYGSDSKPDGNLKGRFKLANLHSVSEATISLGCSIYSCFIIYLYLVCSLYWRRTVNLFETSLSIKMNKTTSNLRSISPSNCISFNSSTFIKNKLYVCVLWC